MRTERNDTRRGKGNVNPFDILEGFLLDDLPEATNPLTGATTARLQVIRWDSGGEFYETDLIETITNRSTTFSARAVDNYRDSADITTIQFINGEWRPQGGGGGAIGDRIWFRVIGTVNDILWNSGCEGVFAVVTRVSCGSSVQVGDEVMVFDPDLCWFNLPIELLLLYRGTASWARNDGAVGPDVCPDVPVPGECIWIVDGNCCVEEVYA